MSIVEFPIADRPITESEVDKLHSKAFRDLEGGICDCATMARIAAQIVTNEAGLDGELVFAVAHVSEMLTALKANGLSARNARSSCRVPDTGRTWQQSVTSSREEPMGLPIDFKTVAEPFVSRTI